MIRKILLALSLAGATPALAQGVTDSQIALGQSVALSGPAEQFGSAT